MITWTESIEIDRPVEEVRPAVRDQQVLMRWSAWPQATGYSCAVDGDGVSPGSTIVFTSPEGEEMGRQTIVQADGDVVRNRLRNKGPGGRTVEPEVDFRITPAGPGRTRVDLDFRISPPVPSLLHPLARIYLSRQIRPLHRADLVNLKALLEKQSV